MKTPSIAVLILALAGCASNPDSDRHMLGDKAPTAEFVTEKSVDEAHKCILSGVQAVADSGHTVSSKQDGFMRVIEVTTLANPIIAVRIAQASGGTSVDYRSRYRTGYGKFTNAVMACR